MKLQWSFIVILVIFIITTTDCQRTILDDLLEPTARKIYNYAYNIFGNTGHDEMFYETNRRLGRVQKRIPEPTPFVCDVNGPGRRSDTPPETVHQLRPGDIDIVGAIGDSYTAGTGALGVNVGNIFRPNRGVSSFSGGQENWRKFLTIPNILKEYNKNLFGYAEQDALTNHRSSRFNVAAPGATSFHTIHQANNLIKRMKSNKNVNMTYHWKLVTIMIGTNDFCSDVCFTNPPEKIVDSHERNLITVLRTLRDNIPRLMVNVIHAPDIAGWIDVRGSPRICKSTLFFECGCFFTQRFQHLRNRFESIINNWHRKEVEIVNRNEFHKKNDFTVNLQPFFRNVHFPLIRKGLSDITTLAPDCFHISQKGYARTSTALWNNMLEPDGQKTNWTAQSTPLKCPTEKRPFLATHKNSKLQENRK